MDPRELQKLLEQVRDGGVSPDQAIKRLEHMPFEDLGFAKVDHHRALRHGMPEVVLGLGKTTEEVRDISAELLSRTKNLLVTRATQEMADAVTKLAPERRRRPPTGCA